MQLVLSWGQALSSNPHPGSLCSKHWIHYALGFSECCRGEPLSHALLVVQSPRQGLREYTLDPYTLPSVAVLNLPHHTRTHAHTH